MSRVALALPLAVEDRLAGELERHGHDLVARCASADELAFALVAASVDVAVVEASPRYLTERLIAEADAAGVRLVALVGSDAGRRQAATLGLRELADLTAGWDEIESVLAGGLPAAQPPSADRGEVLAVWGPAGAPGRTTLAINVAAELAAAGHTVAVADVDTYSGSIAPALGLLDEAPGFAAACRLAGTGGLDRAELERIGQRYLSARGGFWVLTGIGRPSRWPELSADRVTTTITECRTWVDYTVLDTGFSLENDEEISSDLFAPHRNAATLAALREADRVIAVGSADPVGLSRFLRAHVDLVEAVETPRLTVVVNRLRSSAIGMNPAAQVRQTLHRFGGITSPVLVPDDRSGLDAAVLGGRTLLDTAVKSPARVAIGRLVEECILPPAPQPSRRVRHRRLEPASG
ncbi:MAG TPA: regulator [Lacisediminihabitans sp.]|uniref:AAA family ATPase n=1 Tax=Lacisediminihabitans sp. TaxID=2787631 RepID=UPI002ED86D79